MGRRMGKRKGSGGQGGRRGKMRKKVWGRKVKKREESPVFPMCVGN